MNDEPRQKLHELIVDYGRSLCNDPNRCEALLKDHCGVHKREIFVLVSALKKKVPDDLLKSSAGVPQEIVIGRLCKRLEDELAFTSEASHWAVESWAMALGLISSPSPIVKTSLRPKPPPVAPKVTNFVPSQTKLQRTPRGVCKHCGGTNVAIQYATNATHWCFDCQKFQ
jgi:hypothetical protein